jgi:BirA family biotin operon repressor/biotin-[acetyl-CoA-carboxylase] ligase
MGAVMAARRALPARDGLRPLAWRLRGLPVCASTEGELERWLAAAAPPPDSGACLGAPLAVLARRQRFGRGQRGRFWLSPAGGAWISAALPWPADPAAAAAPGLAVAVGLALELEEIGLPVQLKWPNDLLVDGRKIAGLLPRLRLRGPRVRWAQVGVGVNGRHRLPPGAGAVSLPAPALAARVLRALEWAVAHAREREAVRRAAEGRLGLPLPPLWHEGLDWQVEGLEGDGRLRLRHGSRQLALHRQF